MVEYRWKFFVDLFPKMQLKYNSTDLRSRTRRSRKVDLLPMQVLKYLNY